MSDSLGQCAVVARKVLLIPTLVLGLLLQAAVAHAEAPCAPETTEQAAVGLSTEAGHGHRAMQDYARPQPHHEMHGGPTYAMQQATDAQKQMPCCDTDEAATCAMSGCATAAPTMTLMSWIPVISHSLEVTDKPVDRLAAYASPTEGIFRPPIA
jgi:hypothetical protein